jgi:hypothetical protein
MYFLNDVASSPLTNQYFQLFAVTATTTQVTINVTVSTQIYLVAVRYVAVNSTFPYHLNILTNQQMINSGNTFSSAVKYTFTMNYSSLVSGTALYKTFTKAASNYNVIMYLTCLNYTAATENSTTKYPPMLNISYSITNNSTVVFTMDCGTKGTIGMAHYTVIVYDINQITNSGGYRLNYTRVNWTGAANHSLPLPQNYSNCAIMGFTAFSSTSTTTSLFFDLYAGTVPSFPNDTNANHPGIYMTAFVAKQSGQTTATNYSFSVFSL